MLASAGATYADRPHAWHPGLAERLAQADPELIRTTRTVAVDLVDPASEEAATVTLSCAGAGPLPSRGRSW